MVEPDKRRIGRPTKSPTPGTRVSLGLKVTPNIKRLLDGAAASSGRTQSQEAEMMIERCLTYDQTLEAMHTTLADMQKDNVEAALRRLGYTPVRVPNEDKPDRPWKLWAEPGYPGIERSEFVP